MRRCLPLVFVALLGLSACSPTISPNSYDASEVGVASHVDQAAILSIRTVDVDNKSSVGGVAGTAAGAVAGTAIGGGLRAGLIGGIGGAVIGGVAGAAVDKAIHHKKGHEYMLKLLQSGKVISVTQVDHFNLQVGDRIDLIYGDRTRIIPDEIPGTQGVNAASKSVSARSQVNAVQKLVTVKTTQNKPQAAKSAPKS